MSTLFSRAVSLSSQIKLQYVKYIYPHFTHCLLLSSISAQHKSLTSSNRFQYKFHVPSWLFLHISNVFGSFNSWKMFSCILNRLPDASQQLYFDNNNKYCMLSKENRIFCECQMSLKQITPEAFWLKTLVFSLNLLKSLFIYTCLDLLWEDHRQTIKLEMFQANHASSYCKK